MKERALIAVIVAVLAVIFLVNSWDDITDFVHVEHTQEVH